MKRKNNEDALLKVYAGVIKRAVLLNPGYSEEKLREDALGAGLVKWTDQKRLQVGSVGMLAGLPGGRLSWVLMVADVTFLMSTTVRGCYGIGYIQKRNVDYKNDIPLIMAIWAGSAHVASSASIGKVALKVANPLIVHGASNAAVALSAQAIQSLAAQTGSKLLVYLMPKLLGKIAAKMAAKTVSTSIPVLGGCVSWLINRWICGGLMQAATEYYSADYVVLEHEASTAILGRMGLAPGSSGIPASITTKHTNKSKKMAKVTCPKCETSFDMNRGESLVTRAAAGAAFASVGAWFGGSVGIVGGPVGGIAGTVPGAAFGGLAGWLMADQFRRCPRCGKIFKT